MGGGEPLTMDGQRLGMVQRSINVRGRGKVMMTMNEWKPALTKEECNNKELGTCYCGECEREGE